MDGLGQKVDNEEKVVSSIAEKIVQICIIVGTTHRLNNGRALDWIWCCLKHRK